MKKSLLNCSLIAVFAAVLFTGCKNMYIPNMPNTPLLREKGDVMVTVNPNNYQGAVALTESFGLMVNGYYRRKSWNLTSGGFDNRFDNQRYMFEGALGYFKKLGSSAVFELYGGGGFGNVIYNYDLYDNGSLINQNTWSANNVKLFIQPNFGIVDKNIEFAVTTRFVMLNFPDAKSVNYTTSEMIAQGINDLEKTDWLFVEPGVVFRYGWSRFKFQNHLLYSAKLNPEPLNTRRLIFGFGLTLNLRN
jgi:hypothetical protein